MNAKENRLARQRENIREEIQYCIRMLLASLLILTVVSGGVVADYRSGTDDVLALIGRGLFFIGIGVVAFLLRRIYKKFKELVAAT